MRERAYPDIDYLRKVENKDRAWTEINLDNLCHNAFVMQKTLPENCRIMAVVKANAYGHGDIEVSKALNSIGVKAFAAATIDEGIHLRTSGVQGEILVLGYTDPLRAYELSVYRLSQTIVDEEYAYELNSQGKPIQAHIKVDTGMHRLGESYEHTQKIAHIFQYPHLKINGIFTHLCVSDSMKKGDIDFTGIQINRFFSLLEELKMLNIQIPKIHIQSSYGLLNYPEIHCDFVRTGLSLYGASEKGKLGIDLKPVLSLKTKVVFLRTIPAGESAGYGCGFIAERDTYAAILPIGYADGIPRSLGENKGSVLIHGRRAPIMGRICMDQLMINVTDIPDVKLRNTATLIGSDGTDEITVNEAAEKAGTIPNELLSRLGERLKRVYI